MNLKRVGNDRLADAILIIGRFGGCFEPREVLLADFDHGFGQSRQEQALSDLATQLLNAIVNFRGAHRGLGLSDPPSQLGTTPERKFLFNTVNEVAFLGGVKAAVAENTSPKHRHRVFPRAHRVDIKRCCAGSGIHSLD